MMNAPKGAEVLAQVTRGELAESFHRGHVAVVRADGAVVAWVGDERFRTYWRSAAKPIQALAVLTTGAADRFHFTDPELAVMAASHAGEDEHVQAVQSILHKAGLTEAALQCGTHPPVTAEMARRLILAGREPEPVQCNCSGKHAGMLAVAAHLGFPVEGYLRPSHPVQQIMLSLVADFCSLPAKEIILGVDGCGVPVFGLPLAAMALAYARLAHPDQAKAEYGPAVRRLTGAMLRHPEMVSGRGRFTTELMVAAQGRVIAKCGAEGVFCLALPEQGLGVAIKVEDGQSRPVPVVALEVLRQLGLDLTGEPGLKAYWQAPVRNNRGEAVGRILPAFTLHWQAGPLT
ncbi:MAG: asparaginase [Firmicutes bacterium]|nr:asparaginase [Bacillota bacterium]